MAILVAPPYRPAAMEDPMNSPELLYQPSASSVPTRLEPATGFHEMDVIQATRTSACVLFTGVPNAKGMALQIHCLSGWRWGPFVSVDCGASDEILERQLFDALRAGMASDDHGEPRPYLLQDGTIFLYEVGKLSLPMQARLSDALGAGGRGETRRRLRKRVMASTSEPLLDRVMDGTFDDRLFYRLNAIHVAR
jgi:DNA-binding NtrC family response regulator